MFKTRLISGIVLVAVALLTICTGHLVLFMTLLGVSVIGMQELYKAMKVREDRFTGLELAGYAGVAGYYLVIGLAEQYALMELIAVLVLLMCVYVFAYPKYRAEQVMAAMFGVIYVGVMLSFIYQTRSLYGGEYHVWLIFLSSWGCDTCAYCVGVLFGKHKMSPKLSPKKSIEGAVGGIAGSMLLTFLYTCVFQEQMQVQTEEMVLLALISGVGALISMVGDLAASAIKRNYGKKDYGTLIPGHGGILDRFDSVIFTAPVIYYLAAFLLK